MFSSVVFTTAIIILLYYIIYHSVNDRFEVRTTAVLNRLRYVLNGPCRFEIQRYLIRTLEITGVPPERFMFWALQHFENAGPLEREVLTDIINNALNNFKCEKNSIYR